MILIHTWADGSFTTQRGGRDMSAWEEHQQAAKHGCVTTYVSPAGVDSPSFCEAFYRLQERDLEIPASGAVMGRWQKRRNAPYPNAKAWQLRASICIADFGAWFEPVTGPTAQEILMDRLERLIATRGECSIGVLVNLVRPIHVDEVKGALFNLMRHKRVEVTPRKNPKNSLMHDIYSLSE